MTILKNRLTLLEDIQSFELCYRNCDFRSNFLKNTSEQRPLSFEHQGTNIIVQM